MRLRRAARARARGRVTPSARNRPKDRRRRSADRDCVENTRNAPVQRATSASMLRFTRYARVTVAARSRSTCGAMASVPAGRRRLSATRKARASTPGFEREVDAIQASDLAEQPLRRGDVHDAERLGISPLGQDIDDAQISRAIADEDTQSIAGAHVELARPPDCSTGSRPARTDRARDARTSPMRAGCRVAATKGSRPKTLSVSRSAGSATSSSSTGLATRTAGSRASSAYSCSANPSRGPRITTSASPTRRFVAKPNSLSAAALTR